MPDFLLELLSEEIPARMQAKASADLARLFEAELGKAGLRAEAIETCATPRRLALIARNLPAATEPVREEVKGPRASAPPQALEGFLRKTGLSRDQLEERDGILFAVTDRPGRPTANVLAEAIPALVRAFPWPKSMRWGADSVSTESLRWVRPLQGIVALLGEQIVDFEIAGLKSGAATVGHRFHHPGVITIGSANDYAEKLRACHVIVDPAERRALIAEDARAAAAKAGLALVEDEGLLAENAGLTEWPVPLLGRFDPAFLKVPREVIQLTMRTNQKYFACTIPPRNGEGDRRNGGGGGAVPNAELAPNFVCTANIDATDGGTAIVAGNERVLSARLSDAKFFWEQDLKVPLEQQAAKLDQIVFHEKLGTVADKVERVAKLARWLVEEGIVGGSGGSSRSPATINPSRHSRESGNPATDSALDSRFRGNDEERAQLADLTERAARLAKADLVTGLVGEFPELQGAIGGHLARAQGEPPEVADAIRDHYKPVGQGDEVPTAPATVAVSLADKLDTLTSFFLENERPTGSKDPYALRRAALAAIALIVENKLRLPLVNAIIASGIRSGLKMAEHAHSVLRQRIFGSQNSLDPAEWELLVLLTDDPVEYAKTGVIAVGRDILDFFADRLKVQQREAGVRHDLIDAVFNLGVEDDLVRLLARVRALQTFVETAEGTDLLAGYKRAANILKKEGWSPLPLAGGVGGGNVSATPSQTVPPRAPPASGRGTKSLSYTPAPAENALIAALDAAEPRARTAVEAEDFEGAMAALASLRAPVDAFFDKVTVNDPDPVKREARLKLLARMRDAVHQVADFSRIEG
ncbi:MAG TPA: glycine--tRNA ligase subunit beta [Allosphingosinicella sp.]|jgi:glycyl-tRNA synthetase beta chain